LTVPNGNTFINNTKAANVVVIPGTF